MDHWGFAVGAATYIRNRLPTKGNPNRLSAYQMETGKAPDLSKLVPFGTVGYAHQLYPQQRKDKMEGTAKKARVVGGPNLLNCELPGR